MLYQKNTDASIFFESFIRTETYRFFWCILVGIKKCQKVSKNVKFFFYQELSNIFIVKLFLGKFVFISIENIEYKRFLY